MCVRGRSRLFFPEETDSCRRVTSPLSRRSSAGRRSEGNRTWRVVKRGLYDGEMFLSGLVDAVGMRVLDPRPSIVSWSEVMGSGGGCCGGILEMAVSSEVRSWRGVGSRVTGDGDDADMYVWYLEQSWRPSG